jgi:endonuclease-3
LNCGYPASDARCLAGFQALQREVGTKPDTILGATAAQLMKCLREGGIFPELRATRLQEIAQLVQKDFGGDLRSALAGSLVAAAKALKRFPTIGVPGAERILLFCGIAALPAVPANCLHVPQRLGFGTEAKSFARSYKAVQQAVAAELPAKRESFVRAYLLLRHHAQELCKRSAPHCGSCPAAAHCPYYRGTAGLIKATATKARR